MLHIIYSSARIFMLYARYFLLEKNNEHLNYFLIICSCQISSNNLYNISIYVLAKIPTAKILTIHLLVHIKNENYGKTDYSSSSMS